MTSKNKARGNALEYEVVREAHDFGIKAKRAYASNGESLGKHAQVDALVGDFTVQCKRMKTFPKCYEKLLPETHDTDLVVFRQDGKPITYYAVINYRRLLLLMQRMEAREDFYLKRVK